MSSLEETFRDAAEALARPAGRNPEFASREAIAAHREAFVRACHQTWRVWQQQAVEQILAFDEFLRIEKARPVGHHAEEFGQYMRAIWRKVNDAIVWSIFGEQRWVVKRFCLYRPRTYLSESNAESVLRMLAALNANPLSFALWNDATSLVDIGDITYVEDGLRPEPTFIELKEGEVNAEILELMELGGAELEARLRIFAEARKQSGLKQFGRVLRQQRTGQQALELLLKQRGTDPATGQQIEIVDVGLEHLPYDEALGALLERALEQGTEVVELLEGCLWVYATGDPNTHRAAALQRFQALLEEKRVAVPTASVQRGSPHDRDRIVELQWAHFQPLAKPLLLRRLRAHVIASLIGGRLSYKAFVYLDWQRFSELVADAGARFAWSTEKQARRMRAEPEAVRAALLSGRLAQIHVEDVRMSLTDPSLVQMYFDGTPPKAIIERAIASAQHLKASRRTEPPA